MCARSAQSPTSQPSRLPDRGNSALVLPSCTRDEIDFGTLARAHRAQRPVRSASMIGGTWRLARETGGVDGRSAADRSDERMHAPTACDGVEIDVSGRHSTDPAVRQSSFGHCKPACADAHKNDGATAFRPSAKQSVYSQELWISDAFFSHEITAQNRSLDASRNVDLEKGSERNGNFPSLALALTSFLGDCVGSSPPTHVSADSAPGTTGDEVSSLRLNARRGRHLNGADALGALIIR